MSVASTQLSHDIHFFFGHAPHCRNKKVFLVDLKTRVQCPYKGFEKTCRQKKYRIMLEKAILEKQKIFWKAFTKVYEISIKSTILPNCTPRTTRTT